MPIYESLQRQLQNRNTDMLTKGTTDVVLPERSFTGFSIAAKDERIINSRWSTFKKYILKIIAV